MALVAHVAFLGFFRIRKKLFDVIYVGKRPGEIVVIVDALEPGGLGCDSSGAMEVSDCFFKAGQVLDIIDCLGGVWAMRIGGKQFNVVENSRGRGYSVERVEGLTIGGPINEDHVHAQVGDMCLERHTP